MVVESDFADREHLWVIKLTLKRRHRRVDIGVLVDVLGVYPDDGIAARVFLGKRNHFEVSLGIRAGVDYANKVARQQSGEDVLPLAVKRVVVVVRVRVEQCKSCRRIFERHQRTRSPSGVSGSRNTTRTFSSPDAKIIP